MFEKSIVFRNFLKNNSKLRKSEQISLKYSKIEAKLEKRVPQPFRLGAHHWLILHGRYVCKARTPECWRCPVVDLCSYRKKVLERPKGR